MSHVLYVDLPNKVHGCSCFNKYGEQTIVLNSKNSFEQNLLTLQHERNHRNDYNLKLDVDYIELLRHHDRRR